MGFSMQQFAAHKIDLPPGEYVGMAPTGTDQNLAVEFYTRPSLLPNQEASDAAGYPVYKDVPWIRILIPGDRTKSYDRPAKLESEGPNDQTPPDHLRFPRQWQAYKQQTTKAVVGLPLEEWPAITRSEAESLKRMDIHTVEQLASMPDSSVTWLGGQKRVQQAKAWLESAKDHAGEARLSREVEQLRAQVESLLAQNKELADRLGNEHSEVRRGPGRPRRDQV